MQPAQLKQHFLVLYGSKLVCLAHCKSKGSLRPKAELWSLVAGHLGPGVCIQKGCKSRLRQHADHLSSAELTCAQQAPLETLFSDVLHTTRCNFELEAQPNLTIIFFIECSSFTCQMYTAGLQHAELHP